MRHSKYFESYLVSAVSESYFKREAMNHSSGVTLEMAQAGQLIKLALVFLGHFRRSNFVNSFTYKNVTNYFILTGFWTSPEQEFFP